MMHSTKLSVSDKEDSFFLGKMIQSTMTDSSLPFFLSRSPRRVPDKKLLHVVPPYYCKKIRRGEQ